MTPLEWAVAVVGGLFLLGVAAFLLCVVVYFVFLGLGVIFLVPMAIGQWLEDTFRRP